MTSLNPLNIGVQQKPCSNVDNVQYCRMMLYLHDFLSPSENTKVKARIEKWLKANNVSLKRTPKPLRQKNKGTEK